MSEETPQQAVLSKSESPPLTRIGLNDHKAGMEGLDKDKINQIILEASKGSKYYQNELRKDQEINRKVNHMLDSLKKITETQRAATAKAVEKKIQEMEMSRDLSRIIVHVDMDAFYAAVEMRDDPSLRDHPMAVGSNSMLSTSNYVARRYGVRAAMPGFIARKLCPDLVIVNPNYRKYHRASMEVQKVLSEYDPNFCSVGLDESYLDITDYVKERVDSKTVTAEKCSSSDSSLFELSKSHYICAEVTVEDIRENVLKATGLTASAGIAPNKMLAKIASDMNKPNGQFMVKPTRENILEFLKELPIRKISGIGRVTEKMLKALDITLCCHLYDKKEILHLLFSQASSDFFLASCLGLGSVEVQRLGDRKSMSAERSFRPTSEPREHMARCQELCRLLAEDMEKERIVGHTVTVKMKTSDFEVKTRGLTMLKPMSKVEEIFQVAGDLLQQEIKDNVSLKLRLLGVKVTALQTSRCIGSSQETLRSFLRPANVTSKSTTCSEEIQHHVSCDTSSPSQVTRSLVVCPICGVQVSINNLILNQHIDECLNRESPNATLIANAVYKRKRSQRTLESYFSTKDKCIKKQKHTTV